MQKPRNLIFIAALLAFFAAGYAHAQLTSVPDPVQYSVSPETPAPGQRVTIVAQGVGGFLGDATITWTQGGKVILSGVGETEFSFIAGSLGTQTRVQVRIVSSTQGTFSHDFTFTPALVSLIWEADTSAPPLYRGKPVYSAGSNIKVIAFPTVTSGSTRISSSALTFKWSRDDTPITAQSGLGRNTFSLVGDQLQNQENISVEVYYGANKVGYGEISIPATEPLLLFYVKDPLRGMLYDTALPNAISLSSKEITIQATPYFFANSSLKKGSLMYAWTLNGEDSTGPDSAKGILTLRQTGSGQGTAAVGVEVQNNDSDKFVQTAQAALQILFGQSSSGSLFGL